MEPYFITNIVRSDITQLFGKNKESGTTITKLQTELC